RRARPANGAEVAALLRGIGDVGAAPRPPASAPRSALTAGEQRLLSVLFVGAEPGAATAATVTADACDAQPLTAIAEQAGARGGPFGWTLRARRGRRAHAPASRAQRAGRTHAPRQTHRVRRSGARDRHAARHAGRGRAGARRPPGPRHRTGWRRQEPPRRRGGA